MRLQVLGPVGVRRADGSTTGPRLTQPRHLAVLAYLALARPRGLHSRDTLVMLLWPEADQAGGRHALRNVLHALRQALGVGVIVTAGDGLVGVDRAQLACDALELEDDLAAGRHDRALARYEGELLQGFHVSDAPEFERWLDGERRRLHDAVLGAAWSRVQALRTQGDVDGALRAARVASALAPDDEPSLRRLLALLVEGGDRAAAARAYEEFAERLKREYGAEPAAETQALARSLRDAPSPEALRAAAPVPPASPPMSRAHTPPTVPGALPGSLARAEDAAASGPSPPPPPPSPLPRRRRSTWVVGASVALLVAGAASGGMLASARGGRSAARDAGGQRRLVVLPMDNETGDARLDYIAAGIAEGVAHRLEGIGGITVRSGARSDWPVATRHDLEAIGHEFGAVILLKTTLARLGDSLEVRAAVVDLATSGEKTIAARPFAESDARDVESALAASVAGALFRAPQPSMPRAPVAPVDPESYRLTLAGWHRLLTFQDARAAQRLFTEATTIDPLNARAWAGLSSAWATQAMGSVPLDVAYEPAEAAALRAIALDSSQGTAWANLGILRALKYRKLSVGEELLRKAVAADPANAEVFLVRSALYRHARQWDAARDAVRIARRLDPFSRIYMEREALIDLCADQPEAALGVLEAALASDPSDATLQQGRIRTLAWLGRYDDAIAAWRAQTATAANRPLAELLAHARGADGYWAARHLLGAARLQAMAGARARGEAQPLAVAQAQFAAGDSAAGYETLAFLERQQNQSLYRLPCMPDFDEVRRTPHFRAIVERVGGLPAR